MDSQKPNPDRLMLGRGPCVQENLAVGPFLFSDVINVVRKLMKNRKYQILLVLKIDTNFQVSRSELEVTFRNDNKVLEVTFSQLGNACMWQQYANYCKGGKGSTTENSAEGIWALPVR